MDEKMNRNRNVGRRLKIFAGLVVLVFAVTLALIVGNRLSDEALAVLAGAVCGVGAAIPTSLLIVSVTQRRRDESRAQPPTQQGAYPPVVVVTPPGTQQRPDAWHALPPPITAPMQRQFTVVGGAPVDTEVRTYERYS
jgi:hypothetical protein